MLIITLHNDGSSLLDGVGNYNYTVKINTRVIERGRIEDHLRSEGWRALLARIVEKDELLNVRGEDAPVKRKLPFNADTVRETGILERHCPAGIGHPVGHTRGWLWEYETVHGCSGGCAGWPTMPIRTRDVE